MMTSRAPFSLATTGSRAAGLTTSELPTTSMTSASRETE